MSHKISDSVRQDNKVPVATRLTGYRKPQLIRVGSLGDIRAKTGRYGDHDTGYYYSRSSR